MNHNGPFSTTFGTDVFQSKPFWQVEVALDRGALPLTTNCITNLDINLGSIKGTPTLIDTIAPTLGLECSFECHSSSLPNGIGTNRLFGTSRKHNVILVKAESGQNFLRQVQNSHNLGFQLLRKTIDVSIILGKSTYTHQTVECSGSLVSVDGSKFCPSNGQVTVGSKLILVHQAMERTVHGFDLILFVFDIHLIKHIRAIEIKMSGSFPQVQVRNMGSVDDVITTILMGILPEILNQLSYFGSLGVPKH
mmetsp:Transcript_111249/g.319660  ORF Transcript_111249/g.319660 Transcript_111249/m.319660 type:complete len:250 (-) Transcript_111249:970-1719(-)